jgi:molecular chaperone IbpA
LKPASGLPICLIERAPKWGSFAERPGHAAGQTHHVAPLEDMDMTFDFSPVFRSTIGFDHLSRLLDSAASLDEAPTYPPYNIEKTGDNAYRITMAVAGFGEDDLAITAQDNVLAVSGRAKPIAEKSAYLHRGIAGRAFDRKFQLADFVKVTGARLENGLLHIDLAREVPEEMRPRRIAIERSNAKVIESKAA